MSSNLSYLATGFFALSGGHRIQSTTTSGRSVNHCYYSTAIKTSVRTHDSSEFLPATLSAYSPTGETPLPDDTIVFVVAKVFTPDGDKPVELEALHIRAVPGDPQADTYEVCPCPTESRIITIK